MYLVAKTTIALQNGNRNPRSYESGSSKAQTEDSIKNWRLEATGKVPNTCTKI